MIGDHRCSNPDCPTCAAVKLVGDMDGVIERMGRDPVLCPVCNVVLGAVRNHRAALVRLLELIASADDPEQARLERLDEIDILATVISVDMETFATVLSAAHQLAEDAQTQALRGVVDGEKYPVH